MKVSTMHEIKDLNLATPPEILQRFFGAQPEIATDGATITTDGGCNVLRPVENKEDEPCQE